MTKKKKVYYKNVAIVTPVPFCPKCNKQVEVPTDKDFRTMATYRCGHCGYIE